MNICFLIKKRENNSVLDNVISVHYNAVTYWWYEKEVL